MFVGGIYHYIRDRVTCLSMWKLAPGTIVHLNDDAPRVRSKKVTTIDRFVVVTDPMATRCKRQAVVIPSLIEVKSVSTDTTMLCWRQHLHHSPVYDQVQDAWLSTSDTPKVRALVPFTRRLIVRLLDSSSDSDGNYLHRDASARAFRKRRHVLDFDSQYVVRREGFVQQRAFPSRDIPS